MTKFNDILSDVHLRELRNIVGQNIVSRVAAKDSAGVEALADLAAELGFVDYDGEVVDGLDHYLLTVLQSDHHEYPGVESILKTAGRARDVTDLDALTVHVNVDVQERDIADGVQGNCSLCAFGLALQRSVGDDHHVYITGEHAYLDGRYYCWLPNKVRTFIDLFDRNPDISTESGRGPFRVHLVFVYCESAIAPQAKDGADTFFNGGEPLWEYWFETDDGVKQGEIRAKTLQFARGVLKSAFPDDWGADGELTDTNNHSFPVWRE